MFISSRRLSRAKSADRSFPATWYPTFGSAFELSPAPTFQLRDATLKYHCDTRQPCIRIPQYSARSRNKPPTCLQRRRKPRPWLEQPNKPLQDQTPLLHRHPSSPVAAKNTTLLLPLRVLVARLLRHPTLLLRRPRRVSSLVATRSADLLVTNP